jgi:hypothetical protein
MVVVVMKVAVLEIVLPPQWIGELVTAVTAVVVVVAVAVVVVMAGEVEVVVVMAGRGLGVLVHLQSLIDEAGAMAAAKVTAARGGAARLPTRPTIHLQRPLRLLLLQRPPQALPQLAPAVAQVAGNPNAAQQLLTVAAQSTRTFACWYLPI